MKYRLTIMAILLIALFISAACSSETDSGGGSEASSAGTSAVKAETLVNINLREGPGTNYLKVGEVAENSEVTVVGRNEDSSWLLVETDGKQAWISADPELVKVDGALVAGLPVVDAPDLAYDARNPKVHEVLDLIPLVIHHEGSFTCASHGGIDNLLPEVKDGNVIGPHAGDFVWIDQGNVLFKNSNGGLVLIRENPIARFEGGAESLPLAQALKMFETGEIVWNGVLGQSPARGVTGCDEWAP